MARIHSSFFVASIGLLLLHTTTGQAVTSTAGTGKTKADHSTVVWSVSTDTMDPTNNAAGQPQVNTVSSGPTNNAAGQPEVNTMSSVNNIVPTKETLVAMETTTATLRPETTTLQPVTSPQTSITPTPADLKPVTTAPPSQQSRVTVPDPSVASPNIRTDVTDTVMALLNETGYSGSANDANVQEIVAMLMNGTVPTDADLIRLGFIPQPSPAQTTTPVPYIIPGNPPVDTNVGFPNLNLPTGNQAGPSTGIQPGPSIGGFPTGGFPIGGFPSNPQIGIPTGPQTGPSTGGTGSATDPFGGGLVPQLGGGGIFPSFPSMSGTSPKPALGDPFSMNAISGGVVEPLPNLGPNPNALGPKPFPSGSPIGGLGTPGSTTDLLASLGPLPGTLGGFPPSPQTGILDAPHNPHNQRGGGMMNNPLMMMMMMSPELMDQAMSGENPMLMYMLMQQMNRKPPRPRPTLPSPSGMGSLSGLGGFPGGFSGAGGGMPLPGSPSMGGSSSGLMDLMNSLGPMGGGSLPGSGLTPTGGTLPMDLSALTGLGTSAGMLPGALGGNPMDLIPTAVPSPGGPAAGPTDMSAFLNMINAGPTGTPGAAPLTDPFLGTAG